MKGWRERLLIAVAVISLFGAFFGEHLTRRGVERRYRQAVDTHSRLERQFAEVIATHSHMAGELAHERQRSRELAGELVTIRSQLEQTIGRLTAQTQSVSELQGRLTLVQQQMEQLQGELAAVIQERPKDATQPQQTMPVQLERIVIGDAGTASLEGRVISVHRDWDFVVIDLGWDAVRIGETVSIFRDDRLLAKARIERVQEGACAATVLPQWNATEIKINDLVKVL